MKSLSAFASNDGVLIAAHRGSSQSTPENSLPAFRLAVESGADMIETDIQFTGDGKIVAVHDIFIDGKSVPAETLKYENIKSIDIGSTFSDDYKGETIPLLSDLLDLAKDNVYLTIEIKDFNKTNLERKINSLLATVNRADMSDKVLFCSFNKLFIKELKRTAPHIPAGNIMIPDSSTLPSELSKSTGAEVFICSLDELNNALVDDALKNNIFIGVYSVSTEDDLKKVLTFPVKGIGTDNPELIVPIYRMFKGTTK